MRLTDIETGLDGTSEGPGGQLQAFPEPKTNLNSVLGQVGEKDTGLENSTKVAKNNTIISKGKLDQYIRLETSLFGQIYSRLTFLNKF